MAVGNVTLNNLAGTDTAVVRTLGSRETVGGPSVRPVVEIKESVLLLETEPRLVLSVELHELSALMAVVELVGRAIRIPALGKDENIWGA